MKSAKQLQVFSRVYDRNSTLRRVPTCHLVRRVQVKKAYRDLARRFHPDKAETEGLSPEEAQSKFTDIAAAYEACFRR